MGYFPESTTSVQDSGQFTKFFCEMHVAIRHNDCDILTWVKDQNDEITCMLVLIQESVIFTKCRKCHILHCK